MSRVALVGPELEENLSLRYLASSLAAAGFEPMIVPFNRSSDLPGVVGTVLGAGEPPSIVGLSLSFQRRAKDFLGLAVMLRKEGYAGHITGGGHFGTFACREILRDFPEIDSLCRHEAEETLARLARAIATAGDLERVPGLALRDVRGEVRMTGLPVPPDLATLPFPDRRGKPTQCLGHRVAPLVGSRGCYACCSFCCISAWHEQTLPGKRFRMRSAEDVADEMARLHAERRIEVFVFHDDNFFLPDRTASLRRIHSLGQALDRRGVRGFATVVKARPDDLDGEVVEAMKERLGLIRVFVGVETDSELGLRTLGRRVGSGENHRALELIERAGVYACFNLLAFDPSTRVEDVETNLRFMERFAEVPMNFGRVELYAGTPLLARLQAEGRCTGDYLEWDYPMADGSVQRIFDLAMSCFYARNFSDESAPHRLMGTRFCVEVAARFHPEAFREDWREQVKRINASLTRDSVAAMREIVGWVVRRGKRGREREDEEFAGDLSRRLRAVERGIREAAGVLETEIQDAVRGAPGVGRSHPHGHEARGGDFLEKETKGGGNEQEEAR